MIKALGIDPGRTHDPTGLVFLEGTFMRIDLVSAHSWKNMPFHVLASRVWEFVHMHPGAHIIVEANGIIGQNCIAKLSNIPGLYPMHTVAQCTTTSKRLKAVPKVETIHFIRSLLQQKILHISPQHTQLWQQIQDITSYTTPNGSTTYRAQKGRHDDMLMALCMAIQPFMLPMQWRRQQNNDSRQV